MGAFRTVHETGRTGGARLDVDRRVRTEKYLFGVEDDTPLSSRPVYGYFARPDGEQFAVEDAYAKLRDSIVRNENGSVADRIPAEYVLSNPQEFAVVAMSRNEYIVCPEKQTEWTLAHGYANSNDWEPGKRWSAPFGSPEADHIMLSVSYQTRHVKQYGNIQVEFNPETEERSTMSGGDSLDRKLLCVPVTHARDRNPVLGEKLRDAATSEKTAELFSEPKADFGASGWEIGYIETQIHGGVTLDDVAHVRFHGQKPTKQMRERLEDCGIWWEHHPEPKTLQPLK